jgi:hypothetical protein
MANSRGRDGIEFHTDRLLNPLASPDLDVFRAALREGK